MTCPHQFSNGYYPIVGAVRHFVREWCPDKLTLSALNVFYNVSLVIDSKDNLSKIFLQFVLQQVVAVLKRWFSRFTSFDLEAIHDCYISEYDPVSKELKILESDTEH